jgi:hypothetical protein
MTRANITLASIEKLQARAAELDRFNLERLQIERELDKRSREG